MVNLLRNSIADIKDTLRRLTLAKTLHPVLGHRAEVILDVGRSDHFNAVAIGLDIGPVLGKELISRDGDGGEGSSFSRSSSGSGMGNVGTHDHSTSRRSLGVQFRDCYGISILFNKSFR